MSRVDSYSAVRRQNVGNLPINVGKTGQWVFNCEEQRLVCAA